MSGAIITARENPYKKEVQEEESSNLDFAVKWDYGTFSNYELERVGDTVDFDCYPMTTSFKGTSTFDNYYPWKGMKICYLSPEGEVIAYEGEPGFEWNPETGDIMVEIPKFWYGIEVDEENKYAIFHVSNTEREGYYVSPRHHKFGDMKNDFDKIYVSAYNVTLGGRSISGAECTNRQYSLQTQLDRGGVPGYYQMDYLTLLTIELLRLVEMANQSIRSLLPSGSSSSFYSGELNSFYHTGYNESNGSKSNRYRYLERFARIGSGVAQQQVQGFYIHEGKAYISYNPSQMMTSYQDSEVVINFPFDGYTTANGTPYCREILLGVTKNNPDAKYQDWTAFIPSSCVDKYQSTPANRWRFELDSGIKLNNVGFYFCGVESLLEMRAYNDVITNSTTNSNTTYAYQRLIYLPPEK